MVFGGKWVAERAWQAPICDVSGGNTGFTPYLGACLAFYNSFDIYQFNKCLLRIFLANEKISVDSIGPGFKLRRYLERERPGHQG
jgi:hypothetical protein